MQFDSFQSRSSVMACHFDVTQPSHPAFCLIDVKRFVSDLVIGWQK